MTVVVGLVGKRGVMLAADSQWSTSDMHRMRTGGKTFVLGETLAIAYCGSGRLGQILAYHLKDSLEDPPLGMDEQYWAVREFIPYLRGITEAHGHLHVHHNVESLGPSAFLLAVRKRLFTVEDDFQVGEHVLPYECVGSGEDAAVGSLHARLGTARGPINGGDKRLLALATAAIKAAGEFTNFVGGPVNVVKTTDYTDGEKALARKILRGG